MNRKKTNHEFIFIFYLFTKLNPKKTQYKIQK